jgi:2,2-dialkylglycine decarboxylase (pyruvate)
MKQRFENIGDIRGWGQPIGCEPVSVRRSKEPAKEKGRTIARESLANGPIFSVRRDGSVLRFVPPATTKPKQIDAAMDILGAAIDCASARSAPARP